MSHAQQHANRTTDERLPAAAPDAAGLDDILDDVVLFDVRVAAQSLYDRLRVDREAWVQFRNDDQFVAVAVSREPDDLASLLRTVQGLLQERGYARMRFELDGRAYSLRLPR